jgi:hypothetical protein
VTRRIAVLLIAGAAAALLAQPALGKGPIEASVDGPGLASPIRIGDRSNWGDEDALAPQQPIMQLAEASGFFPQAFGPASGALPMDRPPGELGPRYVVKYRVPGNDGFRVTQDLYPYAKPSPVTYMAPRQRLFENGGTPGGWFVADDPALPQLLPIVRKAGLPERPSTSPDGSAFPFAVVGSAAAALALLGLAAVALVVVVRRRPRPAM